ncbi:MAG: sugar phosphate isomerase/epimerase [Deltaproteobacteria bacterium]|nr:MAG: sugar phosphate isomerase/epimerase [Deltaproteobacteria bacterium]
MRIGYCTNLINTQADGTGSQFIEKGKEKGFDYVELPLAQMVALNDADYNFIKEKLSASGLECEACNNFFPPSIRLTGNDVDFGKIEDYLAKALGRAAELGVKVIVFGSPMSKNIPEGFPKDTAWSQLVELLRFIDPLAKEKGITIAIEPICKGESNFINTAAEGLKLAKDADRDTIRLLIDYYHLALENENPEIILEAAPYLKHIHFADPKGRAYPQEVKNAYVTFVNLLKHIGYKSLISIEALSKNFDHDAKHSVEVMRQLTK